MKLEEMEQAINFTNFYGSRKGEGWAQLFSKKLTLVQK